MEKDVKMQCGLAPEQIDAVIARLGGTQGVLRFLEDLPSQTMKVIIDCTKLLEDMIKACNFDWVNNDINSSNFPIQGTGMREVEVTLLPVKGVMTSEEIIIAMQAEGFRPGYVEELLAVAAADPELQKRFPIMSLGSLWPNRGVRTLPCLDYRASRRRLVLDWFEASWYKPDRIVAVRLPPPNSPAV